jgi:hypothetical protein
VCCLRVCDAKLPPFRRGNCALSSRANIFHERPRAALSCYVPRTAGGRSGHVEPFCVRLTGQLGHRHNRAVRRYACTCARALSCPVTALRMRHLPMAARAHDQAPTALAPRRTRSRLCAQHCSRSRSYGRNPLRLPVGDDDGRGVGATRCDLNCDGCAPVSNPGAKPASIKMLLDGIQAGARDDTQTPVCSVLVFRGTPPRCRCRSAHP